MLCQSCACIFSAPKFSQFSAYQLKRATSNDRALRPLHPNFASLKAALLAGCRLCHRLVDSLNGKTNLILSRHELCPSIDLESFGLKCRLAYETKSASVISFTGLFEATRGGEKLEHLASVFLFLATGKNTNPISARFLTLTDIPEQSPLVHEISLAKKNGPDTPSVETIRSWVENCLKAHPSCSHRIVNHRDRRFARILDVGHVPDGPRLSLCPSDQLPSNDIYYMTLSHCWGGVGSKIPSLTTKTYRQYTEQIEIATLPRTFRDVVQLTRCLGIQYLWIDSLCIIQDSEEDWLDQAAVMGEIYQGSYLNVASTKSEDANGGLFTTRNPEALSPLRIPTHGTIPTRIATTQKYTELPYMALEEGNELVIIPNTSRVKVIDINLNACLGNDNGDFDTTNGARDFDLSARCIMLVGTTLSAELRAKSGEWKRDTIDINYLVRDYPSVAYIQLLGGSILRASMYRSSQKVPEHRFDLNKCIGNASGIFNIHGTGFASSARNVHLTGTHLHADLESDCRSWMPAMIDIGVLIDWSSERPRIREHKGIFYDADTNHHQKWATEIAGAKLCSRAWILQERILAPRVVHFATKQLFWECKSAEFCESSPREPIDRHEYFAQRSGVLLKSWDIYSEKLNLQPKERDLGINYLWSSLKAMHGRKNISFRKEDLYHDKSLRQQARQMCYGNDAWKPTHPLVKAWSRIIHGYAGSKITYDEDRLIAIAGLAKVLSAQTGICYAAGLWAIQLPRQLLWTVCDIWSKPGYNYIAPSWSWASIPSHLSSRALTLDPILESKGAMDLIKIISINMEPVVRSDFPPFGRLRSGRLRVRGRLLPIRLDPEAWPRGVSRSNALVEFWTTSSVEFPQKETFLVPVIFTRWNAALRSGTPNALLLEWTGEKGIFRRIGTARLSSRCDLRQIIPKLYEALNTDHEDEDDDAETDGEALPEDDRWHLAQDTTGGEPSPMEELGHEMIHHLSSDSMQRILSSAAKVEERILSSTGRADNERISQPARKAEPILNIVGQLNSLEMCSTPRRSTQIDNGEMEQMCRQAEEIVKSLTGSKVHIEGCSRRTMRVPRHIHKMSPKAAVGTEHYLEYLEDSDVSRYGHFQFEIC